MNFARKAASAVLALLLCVMLIIPARATAVPGDPASKTFNVNFTEVNETVYAMASVNIRVGPGTNYEILTQLRYGYSVNRIGVGDNGWSMVIWDGQVVYIYSSYLSNQRPQGYNSQIDDGDLLHAVAIANGLKRSDYTRESWQVLSEALLDANNALNGTSQAAVDDAEKALERAVDGLVKMDCQALQDVLREADALSQTSKMSELWYELATATRSGADLLTSGDQQAVNEAVEQLRELMDRVRQEMEAGEDPKVVIQEVPVEVPPSDKFCNIPGHRALAVLLSISVLLNAALIALIVIYIRNKKKNRQDDTPLVDYDILDDTF